MGIVLCPKTLKEFYTYLRGAENQVEQEAKQNELECIRKRNINLEGKRLVIDKEAKRNSKYPLGDATRHHIEHLNRTSMAEFRKS